MQEAKVDLAPVELGQASDPFWPQLTLAQSKTSAQPAWPLLPPGPAMLGWSVPGNWDQGPPWVAGPSTQAPPLPPFPYISTSLH